MGPRRPPAGHHRTARPTNWATKGRSAVKRAARDGALAGGTVPVQLIGPGNMYPDYLG